MKFIIPGNPIPKARARTFTRHGKTMTYDAQYAKKRMVQARLTHFIRQAFDAKDKEIVMEASNLAFNHAYEVRLVFYLRIPHSASKSQRNMILWDHPHNIKPDLDNLEKFYLDCANGILYPDDAQIISLSSKKYYCEQPRTEIEIMPIKKEKIGPLFEMVQKIFSPSDLKEFLKDVEKINEFTLVNIPEINSTNDSLSWWSSLSHAIIEFTLKYSKKFKQIEKGAKKE